MWMRTNKRSRCAIKEETFERPVQMWSICMFLHQTMGKTIHSKTRWGVMRLKREWAHGEREEKKDREERRGEEWGVQPMGTGGRTKNSWSKICMCCSFLSSLFSFSFSRYLYQAAAHRVHVTWKVFNPTYTLGKQSFLNLYFCLVFQ